MTPLDANLKKFADIFKESLMALSFNLFGIAAGTIVALNLGLFESEFAPWAIAMYPAIISARGVIAGLLSGRLSTGLHIGTVQTRYFGNTKSFYALIHAILVLTLETSVLMSFVAVLFGGFLWGATIADFFNILGVVLATMSLSLVVITPFTVTVSFVSFKHGLDPDIILYPVESTVSDILVTICYFLVLNIFIFFDLTGRYLIALLGLALLIAIAYILPKSVRKAEFVETIKESIVTLVLVAFIVNVTGSVLGKVRERIEIVGSRPEVYTAYPALIDTIGDVGAVVGSTATTKLALGTLKSSFSAVRNHVMEIFSAWAASLILFAVYSLLSSVIQGVSTLSTFLRFTALLLTTNLMAASSIIIVAYVVAVLTFQRGLDPDNFVIPIESSLADSVTTVSLLVALSLIGLG